MSERTGKRKKEWVRKKEIDKNDDVHVQLYTIHTDTYVYVHIYI